MTPLVQITWEERTGAQTGDNSKFISALLVLHKGSSNRTTPGKDRQGKHHRKLEREMNCEEGRKPTSTDACSLRHCRSSKFTLGKSCWVPPAGADQGTIPLWVSGGKCPGCCYITYNQAPERCRHTHNRGAQRWFCEEEIHSSHWVVSLFWGRAVTSQACTFSKTNLMWGIKRKWREIGFCFPVWKRMILSTYEMCCPPNINPLLLTAQGNHPPPLSEWWHLCLPQWNLATASGLSQPITVINSRTSLLVDLELCRYKPGAVGANKWQCLPKREAKQKKAESGAVRTEV